MHVATLATEHAHEYRRLMLNAYEQEADAFTSTPEERAAEPDSWWLQRMADPNGQGVAFGIFHEGELVGTVALEFSNQTKTKHRAHIVAMYVSRTYRSGGMGRALIQAAIEYARSRSTIRLVTLSVTQGNDVAINLYQACGFKQFGVEPMAILTPSGYKAKVLMWREINENTTS